MLVDLCPDQCALVKLAHLVIGVTAPLFPDIRVFVCTLLIVYLSLGRVDFDYGDPLRCVVVQDEGRETHITWLVKEQRSLEEVLVQKDALLRPSDTNSVLPLVKGLHVQLLVLRKVAEHDHGEPI